jgi:predicted DNA-binding transcriptional regulator AlpA
MIGIAESNVGSPIVDGVESSSPLSRETVAAVDRAVNHTVAQLIASHPEEIAKLQAEGLRAPAAAAFVGVSASQWYELHRNGRCPEPISHLGTQEPQGTIKPRPGILIWRRSELRQWMDYGCPPRGEWLQMREAMLQGDLATTGGLRRS